MINRRFARACLLVCLFALSACGASPTVTPAPTLTPAPATGTAAPNARTFSVLDNQSIINYEATLTLGGLKIGGTFGIKGKTITLVPEKDGMRLLIDIQIDGNSVTGANGLVVDALKKNMETNKFPYGHFIATAKDLLTPGEMPSQTTAVGTVELHGQTRPIEMPITVKLVNNKIIASGATNVELLDFGIYVPTSIMKTVISFKADLNAQEVTP